MSNFDIPPFFLPNKGERKIFGSFFVIFVQYFTRIRIRFWLLGQIWIRKKITDPKCCLSLCTPAVCHSVRLLSVRLSVYLFVCLSVYLPTCLYVSLFVCPSVCLSISPSICMSIHVHLYMCPFVHLCLSV